MVSVIRLTWLFLIAASGQAETLSGRVVSVADGDTVTVLDANRQQHKIRLAGIDAPEKAQPFGDRSKKYLAARVINSDVIVEWDKRDRYDRTIGKIIVNGQDINLEQVKAGMAWWYEMYRKDQSPDDQYLYAQAQLQARDLGVGLWRDVAPVPPWAWRKGERSGTASQ